MPMEGGRKTVKHEIDQHLLTVFLNIMNLTTYVQTTRIFKYMPIVLRFFYKIFFDTN